MRTKKYRITSKFRFTVFAATLMVFAAFLTGTALGLNDASSLSEEPTYIAVKVRAGDTLWDMASEYGPQDKDRREVVYEICRLNEIDGNSIQPGQSILIPDQI